MTSPTAPPAPDTPDFDVSDAELRATGCVKWRYAGPEVLPAWVAEIDARPCPAVLAAVHEAVDRGSFGYPPPGELTPLPRATADFLGRRFGWAVDPERVVLAGDVMAGVLIALTTLCQDAPVVVPVPTYPPFLDVVPLAGRALVLVPCGQDAGRPVLDLDGIAAALTAGARTVLLAQPHNPLGRAFDAAELRALAEVVDRHGARVVSDEIHAPLVLPGATHVPYATVEGAADHTTTVVAASKAWNLPGLKCAQLLAGTEADRQLLRALPITANHGTSSLGIAASVAAYTRGGPWLEGLVTHLDAMRTLFGQLLGERLPQVTWWPMEATYLAWVDARGTGLEDPAAAAMARGRVMVNPGRDFGPGYAGFVRVNLATSAERLIRVVDALSRAWPSP